MTVVNKKIYNTFKFSLLLLSISNTAKGNKKKSKIKKNI